MSNEIQVLIGVPGSGKSTYANALVKADNSYVKISRDEFRHMLKDDYSPGEDIENLISSLSDKSIQAALDKGFNVIVDNTHCTAKYVKEAIRKWAPKARVVLKVIGSELSIKQIKERNAARDKAVPEGVIDKMYKGFTNIVKTKKELQQLIDEVTGTSFTQCTFVQNNKLPKAILVDIDGTIAHMGDGRGPFEWHKVDQDAPDENVLNIIRVLSLKYAIVFMSGRDESCRALTEAWLGVYFKGDEDLELYMRPANNYEKDNIVKRRLFDTHIKDKYYIEAVFDDRAQVVRMWRDELGLKCLQVQDGDF